MTLFDATVRNQEAAAASALNGSRIDDDAQSPGSIVRSRSAPGPNAALLGVPSSSAVPVPNTAPPQYKRSAHSSELWVQVTLCLIVTILLLAVIALPKPGSIQAESASQRNAYELHEALQSLRTAIGDYRFDHGTWPGAMLGASGQPVSNDAAVRRLERQLTEFSDIHGETSALSDIAHPLGPYLEGRFPVNPILGLASVRVLDDAEAWPTHPDDSTGWIYRPRTGEVRANCLGLVPVSSLCYYDL
jgi:hypothetical protein